jgi:DNA-binding transcriptional LysR family regulator
LPRNDRSAHLLQHPSAWRESPGKSGLQMDWDKLRVFHAVAEAGSLTHAGELLNLSQSAVSRQISGLEESLGAPLFHRHARGLILTEQGELLYKTVRDVFAKLSMAQAMITEAKDKPKGPLRITTTVAFGSIWMAPRIKRFIELYPDIQVTIIVDDEELDLTMREADVAIRMRPPRQPDLVQRHLMTLRSHVYATRDYLRAHGRPETPEDLDKHRLIIYGQDARPPFPDVNWLLSAGARTSAERRPILRVNNIYGLMLAIRSGLGLGSLPDYMAQDINAQGENDLVRVLPLLDGPAVETYFVYPDELRHSKRIAVLRDFLINEISKSQF